MTVLNLALSILALSVLALADPAQAQMIRAYVEGDSYPKKSVALHVVDRVGRDKIIARGWFSDALVSPDGTLVGVTFLERSGFRETLLLYREGRPWRRLRPGGFIRTWWFQAGSADVVIYHGAGHGPGGYVRFELTTGRMTDWFEEYTLFEKPETPVPCWARIDPWWHCPD